MVFTIGPILNVTVLALANALIVLFPSWAMGHVMVLVLVLVVQSPNKPPLVKVVPVESARTGNLGKLVPEGNTILK
jgi:hypothetical protein